MALERRTTRFAAIGAAIAMGGGLALVGAAPAQAFDSPEVAEYIAAADIRPDESTYVGWHDGAAAGGSFADATDGDWGLDLAGKVQILNGFDEDADNGDLRDLIAGGIQWSASNAYFQIPLFYDDAAGAQQYTTLRPADPVQSYADLGQQWTTSKAIAGTAYAANATDTLENLLAAIEGANPAADDITLLGYGVFVNSGATGNLYSIKWGSQLTLFGQPEAAPELGAAPFADSTALAEYIENEYQGTIYDGGTFTQGTAGQLSVDMGEAWEGAGAWAAFTFFNVYAYSTPVPVGVYQTDNTGLLTVPLSVETLAALTPGEHLVTVTYAIGSSEVEQNYADAIVKINVLAAPATGAGAAGPALAETGFDATLPLVGGALLLAAGAVLVYRRRAGASA
ncbi:LPXTG cell wall anchor domain-containing protein [Agromyces laixinhei]|uniref:LPXTG cell wall anchor domain-containing protein n=1 Tax=Agromyces laixinhei TaxID=2585717 RepID=UPI0018DBF453|nr:LPXTG cell wall anchor domain-containing protein [Agromyces laixinhei]